MLMTLIAIERRQGMARGRWMLALGIAAGAIMALSPGLALADAIDGSWCSAEGKRLSIEDGDDMVSVEGVIDFLAKTGPNFRPVAITDGFQQHFLKAVAIKDFAQNVEHLSLERLAFDFQLL